MKIAQIASIYISIPPKTYGGTERIVFSLCRSLARRGHGVELFASGDSDAGCPLHAVVPVASQDDPDSTFYLEKEFETRNAYSLYRQGDRFDVIHAHWPTLAPYFSRSTKTPTLITYAYIERELHEYYRREFPHCFPICVSRAQAKMLGDESLPVVYNGVDVEEIPFNAAPEDFVITVGRVTPGKGTAEAIRIARRAGVRLVIVGHVSSHLPGSQDYFLREVKPHIDGDRVRYIERLPHGELVRWMGRARALLFPIQWEEPFGMVVVEAMAAGTPALAYRRGSMAELIQDGATGCLAREEGEMIAGLREAGKISRAACREWVRRNFSIEQMVDGYERLYRSVAGAKPAL